MSDLSYLNADLPIKLVGGNPTTGVSSFYLQVNSDGSVNMRNYDGSGNAITSDSPGTSGLRRLSVATPDTTTNTTALGALNATVSVAMSGLASAGFQVLAGTLVGTLVAEASLDGGTTWTSVYFYDPANSTVVGSIVFSSSNTTKILSILPIGGASDVRVRVSAYTSGTANSLLRASTILGVAGAITAAAFGTVVNAYVTIPNNASQLILAANSNRKYAYISNGSNHDISVQFGSATGLTASTGFVVRSNSTYEIKGDNLFTGNIYGYTNGGSAAISVSEGTP